MDNSNQQQHNAFDDLGLDLNPEEIRKHEQEQEELYNRIDQLIHQTFAQTEPGAELLEIWTESLKMTPGPRHGMDKIEIGIIEGHKSFIRNILITIKKVENHG